MVNVTTSQPSEYSAHNVLAQANKAVYLTDPMNKAPDTSDDAPQDPPESGEPTATMNPEESAQQGHNWEKRHSDLKSYVDKELKPLIQNLTSQVNDLKTQNSELKTQNSDQKIQFPRTPEEFQQFKKDYPELAANMEMAALMALKSRESVIEERLKKIEQVNTEIKGERGWQELEKYHPDAKKLATDPQFQAWISTQKPAVKALISDSDPAVIALGIDMYKAAYNIKSPAQRAKDSSKLPAIAAPQRVEMQSGEKRTYSESEIWKLSDKEFEKLLPDIKLAGVEGRIRKG